MGTSWKKWRIRMLSLVLIVGALGNAGCLWVAAGCAAGGAVAGYAYYKGSVCGTFPAPVEPVFVATQNALRDLGMPVTIQELHPTRARIQSVTGDGCQVRINLSECPRKIPADGIATRVCIRVATFGDQPVSTRILDRIPAHLGMHPVPMPAIVNPEPPLLLPESRNPPVPAPK